MGVTSDALLVKKQLRHLLEGYDSRVAAVHQVLRELSPGLRVSVGSLRDPQVSG